MQRGFGVISLLITLAIVAALSGVMLQGYFRASMAPLLQKLIQQYAITGLPPAYLPKQPSNTAHE